MAKRTGAMVSVKGRGIAAVEARMMAAVAADVNYRGHVAQYLRWAREAGKAPHAVGTLTEYRDALIAGGRYHGGSFAPIIAGIKKAIRGAAAYLPEREAAIVSSALQGIKGVRRASVAVPRSMTLSPAEERKARAAMTSRDAALFRFLMATGARISEAVNVQLSDIAENGDVSTVSIVGKGKKARVLRVPSAIIDYARETYGGSTYLFETSAGRPVNRIYAYQRIREAVAQVTGKRFSPHGCRHTLATRLIEGGAPIDAVSRYLGHSSPSVTLSLYSHCELSDDDLFGAIVNGFHGK